MALGWIKFDGVRGYWILEVVTVIDYELTQLMARI